MAISEVRLLIGGEDVAAKSTLELREPYSNNVNLRVHIAAPDQVDRAVEAAAAAFRTFGKQKMHARAAILAKVARGVAEQKSAFIEALIEATGKTFKDASGEVERSMETLTISSEEA